MKHLHPDAVGGVIGLGLGAALLFWLIPAWVEADADLRLPVDLLPRIVAYALLACSAALLVRVGLSAGPAEDRTAGFEPQELSKFLGMIGLLVLATLGFEVFHFLVVAPLLVAAGMWMYGALRPVSLVLTALLGPLVIWVLGTEVLGRVLP